MLSRHARSLPDHRSALHEFLGFLKFVSFNLHSLSLSRRSRVKWTKKKSRTNRVVIGRVESVGGVRDGFCSQCLSGIPMQNPIESSRALESAKAMKGSFGANPLIRGEPGIGERLG